MVKRNQLCELRHKMRSFRTGAHKAHIAFQNVVKLRDFIESGPPQVLSYSRNPAISGNRRPYRTRIFLGIGEHGAKFENREYFAILANAFLLVENRPARIEFDKESDYRNQRNQEYR